MRVLILKPDPDFPEESDWALDVEGGALTRAGMAVETRSWTAPGELDGFDAVLPLVAWGYQTDYPRWLALLDRLEAERRPVLNPVPVLRWNSDKGYLEELAEAGVPTIPTRRVTALDEEALASARTVFGLKIVIKPPVSAAAYGTHLLESTDGVPEEAAGREMMIQPFYPSVAEEGEYSLLLFGGRFSHALVKRPRAGDYRVQPHLGGTETACEPPEGAIALAEAALAVAQAATAYARVDLLRGPEGALRVIELELIEPALWLSLSPQAPAAFASAVRSAIGALKQPLANRARQIGRRP